MEREYRGKYIGKYKHLFIILGVMSVIFILGMVGINRIVLQNAQEIGEKRARILALNEMMNIYDYEKALNTIEYQLRPEYRPDDPADVMQKYLKFAEEAEGVTDMEIYASIDGKIVAATYWEGDKDLDPTTREWYQEAIEADGEIAFSSVYEDIYREELVVTLSKQIKGSQDVLAVDIYLSEEKKWINDSMNEEDSRYFLCDEEGKLLEYSVQDHSREVVQEKFDEVFPDILAGKHDAVDSYMIGLDGKKRGVYYARLEPGWYAVVTMPYENMTRISTAFRVLGGSVIAVFFLTILLLLVKEHRATKKAMAYNEIMSVLGNFYYALYRVDLKESQYQMVKASDYVRERLPSSGNYEKLMEIMLETMKEEERGEFEATFSVENMRELMGKRVRNFGGEFRRMFNGEFRWVHVQMLYDESLQKNAVVLCFNDVNDAKLQDLSRLNFLKDSLDTADQMSQSRMMFFSKMSHDMRTPLNGIIGLTKLAEGKSPEKMAETLDKINLLGNQLLQLINDTLDIARMEQRESALQQETFSLRENLENLADIFTARAEETGKDFQAKIQVTDGYLEGDWGKIQKILNNLLSNAFKFTEPDGRVELLVTENEDSNSHYQKYCFQVKDDGIGMSEDFLKRIYIPFERDVQYGAAKVAGSGLGMAIVHELVQKMEGTIEIDSTLRKGTTMRVTLPLHPCDKVEATEEEAPVFEGDASLEGKKVLLAEDNEINMEIIVEALKSFGMEVFQAWDGAQALDCYLEHEDGYFDMILLDMAMPVMDGCQAAEAIRKSGRKDAGTIPIVAATANAFAEDIAKTSRAGMNAHISKPVDFQILKNTLKKLLQR